VPNISDVRERTKCLVIEDFDKVLREQDPTNSDEIKLTGHIEKLNQTA
jgi:hypothetical protein